MATRPHRVLISALAVAGLTAGLLAVVPTAAGAASTSRTSAKEAARVDRVKAPHLDWYDCSAYFGDRTQCATATLPLDYDKPTGATTEVALLRLPASDRKKRIGSLFVNPGGPGGSGVEAAAAAEQFLSPELTERFDVVGLDPRGTNYSAAVKCFPNAGAQAKAYQGFGVDFPVGAIERLAWISSSEKVGRGCSTTGKPLSASMSTAEVARDMDVLRRAVGDKKLTFLGFSYGTYLGNVYANMFPDRVRAVAIDGVLDPVGWAGTAATRTVPQTQRIRSGEGARSALLEILQRCRIAGPDYCETAKRGTPKAVYDSVIASLKKKPATITDPETGEVLLELTYSAFAGFLLGDLYAPDAGTYVDLDLSFVADLVSGGAGVRKTANARLATRVEARQREAAQHQADGKRARAFGFALPYDNGNEAFWSVLCTDGLNPAKASDWTRATQIAQQRAPEFGPLWTWSSSPCASSTWTAKDEDAYRGTFSHRTAAPVLVVGNTWDPATNVDGAVAAAELLPSSRLVLSDSWGHTAYGTSECVTNAVDAYLLSVKLPSVGKHCTGDQQPFTTPLEEGDSAKALRVAPRRGLPPVVPPAPGATPRL
ncbi:alpha/beta hydrolase [Cellulomonas massiliensis]|uniref:alpha/beta hydrolase n=1 Tax=Cellulomonas massiliensis TaxID=1465811 RepID=UPI0002FF2A38|nr:alpha/beta hydrolase [Cellulomonas massiliensis]